MRLTIVCYHAVGDCSRADDPYDLYISTQVFAEQMRFLSATRSVVSLEEALTPDTRSSRPLVAITFDDGYRSVLRNAVPILTRYSLPSTMFVPTAYVGGINTWSEAPGDFEIMDEDELRSLSDAAMTVESHGHSHIDYSSCAPAEAASDLRSSVAELERMTGRRPELLAYPYGSTSPSSQAAVRDAGFRAAFTLDERSSGTFGMERVPVLPPDGPRTFAAKTSGYWMPVRRSAAGGAVAAVVRRVARKAR
jgi:peptidoglycan/xylan/chitin deacetylase (PgdA/CDA1 family)